MKILRISSIVIGIHALALILILTSPGCSSTSKPALADTADKPADPAPVAAAVDPAEAPAAAPVPATDAGGPGPTILYAPTRPGTLAASALESQPVAGVTPATTIVVVRGDSLWSIAKKHHLKVSALAAANNLRSGSALHIGQRLVIPAGALGQPAAAATAAPVELPPPAEAPAKASGGAVTHVVRPGETLGAIARRYGVRVGDIATANNISDPQKIRPGQTLVIPNPRRTPGAGGKSAHSVPAAPAPEAASAAPTDQGSAPPAAVPAGADDAPVIKIDDNPPPAAPTNP